VLVADGGTALVFSNTGDDGKHAAALMAVSGGSFKRARTRRYQGPRPGRNLASPATGVMHAVMTHEKQERDDEENFLTEVLAWLVAPNNMKLFDSLIIAAPPRALGELRANMPRKLSAKLSHEIHADLTKAPIKELAQRVAGHLRPISFSP
jgi:protein required for attachment to host cells